ncbi:MAG TPA: T9SS type A sorting domain-containing protein, partial [Bacteroidales bacterium]|nr:T9SS type A sorting domain-containing protein [Bacteroidales bacterium]
DTLIYPIFSGGAGGSCNFYIDLDENGQSDLKIVATAYTSPGTTASFIKLKANNNQTEIAFRDTQIDSFPQLGGSGEIFWTYFYTNIPNIFSYNDTIDQRYTYYDSIFYLGKDSHGFVDIVVDDWLNIGEKYIGVSMQVNDVTLYGWILVEVTDYFSVIVKEFACNKNPYIGISPNSTAKAFELYPNPAKNEVVVALNGEYAGKPAAFALYNLSGKKLLQVDEIPQNGRIALPALAKGLYIVEIEADGHRFSQKLQIE